MTTNATTTMDPIAHLSQPTGYMTSSDESPQEVRSTTNSLLRPKTNIHLATLNVRTMFETSRTAQVTSDPPECIASSLWVALSLTF